MKVIYDYQIFSLQKYGGISRYYFELTKFFTMNHICDVKIIAPWYVNKYISDHKKGIVLGRYLPLISKTYRIKKYYNRLLTKIILFKIKPDIVHETYYDIIKLSPPKTKTVITVYDMIHEKFPEYFPAAEKRTALIKFEAINRADYVICISENTRKDLIEITNIPPAKTSVVHLGFSFTENIKGANKHELTRPFILFVGVRGLYKNFYRFLQAYAASKRLVQDFDLVCFGGYEFTADELTAIRSLGLPPNRVVHFSGSDQILANLYANAAALIYPSLYEGFGIPLLEAMSHECPVVCSNTSSLPEVAGDAAEYFDPYEVDNIKESIENVVYSPERSKALISRGLARISQFSWDKCAQETFKIYSSLL